MPQTTEERVEALKSIPLFAGLNDDTLQNIIAASTEFEVEAGHVLIEAGQAGAGLFVLEEGTVEVLVGGKHIDLGPGEFVGELALLTHGALHAGRVCAKTPMRALAIARKDFQALLHSEPKLALAMLETLASRLASANG